MSVGIYNDPRPDHIACASGQMLLRVEQTDRQMERRKEGRKDV
jgi:hypothetical protein